MDHLRKLVRHPVEYAAIYVEDRPTICVDYYHSKLPDFAQFYEWTMFHDDNNRYLLVDLDGVLCDDWTGGRESVCGKSSSDPWSGDSVNSMSLPRRASDPRPRGTEFGMQHNGRASDPLDKEHGNEEQDSVAYLDFLKNVRPRRIPTYALHGIVTNRLERHRSQTEAWLAKQGIVYGTLTMSPYATFDERDRANDAARRKAIAYGADSGLRLFVESDDQQAQEIARLTGRLVFSIARNGLV